MIRSRIIFHSGCIFYFSHSESNNKYIYIYIWWISKTYRRPNFLPQVETQHGVCIVVDQTTDYITMSPSQKSEDENDLRLNWGHVCALTTHDGGSKDNLLMLYLTPHLYSFFLSFLPFFFWVLFHVLDGSNCLNMLCINVGGWCCSNN